MFQFVLLISILIFGLQSTVYGSATEKQVLRKQTTQKVVIPNGKRYESAPKFTNVKKESSQTKFSLANVKTPSFDAKQGMDLLQSLALTIRDEAVDCFDSLVFAESNSEVRLLNK